MAYFDSAKNRVLWLDELAELKQMKDSYEKTGVDPFTARASQNTENAVAGRTPVAFASLEREEEMDLERQRTRRERDLAARKERTARRLREKEEPELIKDPSLGDRKRGRAR